MTSKQHKPPDNPETKDEPVKRSSRIAQRRNQPPPPPTSRKSTKRPESTPTPEKPSPSDFSGPNKRPTTKADRTPDQVRKVHARRVQETSRQQDRKANEGEVSLEAASKGNDGEASGTIPTRPIPRDTNPFAALAEAPEGEDETQPGDSPLRSKKLFPAPVPGSIQLEESKVVGGGGKGRRTRGGAAGKASRETGGTEEQGSDGKEIGTTNAKRREGSTGTEGNDKDEGTGTGAALVAADGTEDAGKKDSSSEPTSGHLSMSSVSHPDKLPTGSIADLDRKLERLQEDYERTTDELLEKWSEDLKTNREPPALADGMWTELLRAVNECTKELCELTARQDSLTGISLSEEADMSVAELARYEEEYQSIGYKIMFLQDRALKLAALAAQHGPYTRLPAEQRTTNTLKVAVVSANSCGALIQSKAGPKVCITPSCSRDAHTKLPKVPFLLPEGSYCMVFPRSPHLAFPLSLGESKATTSQARARILEGKFSLQQALDIVESRPWNATDQCLSRLLFDEAPEAQPQIGMEIEIQAKPRKVPHSEQDEASDERGTGSVEDRDGQQEIGPRSDEQLIADSIEEAEDEGRNNKDEGGTGQREGSDAELSPEARLAANNEAAVTHAPYAAAAKAGAQKQPRQFQAGQHVRSCMGRFRVVVKFPAGPNGCSSREEVMEKLNRKIGEGLKEAELNSRNLAGGRWRMILCGWYNAETISCVVSAPNFLDKVAALPPSEARALFHRAFYGTQEEVVNRTLEICLLFNGVWADTSGLRKAINMALTALHEPLRPQVWEAALHTVAQPIEAARLLNVPGNVITVAPLVDALLSSYLPPEAEFAVVNKAMFKNEAESRTFYQQQRAKCEGADLMAGERYTKEVKDENDLHLAVTIVTGKQWIIQTVNRLDAAFSPDPADEAAMKGTRIRAFLEPSILPTEQKYDFKTAKEAIGKVNKVFQDRSDLLRELDAFNQDRLWEAIPELQARPCTIIESFPKPGSSGPLFLAVGRSRLTGAAVVTFLAYLEEQAVLAIPKLALYFYEHLERVGLTLYAPKYLNERGLALVSTFKMDLDTGLVSHREGGPARACTLSDQALSDLDDLPSPFDTGREVSELEVAWNDVGTAASDARNRSARRGPGQLGGKAITAAGAATSVTSGGSGSRTSTRLKKRLAKERSRFHQLRGDPATLLELADTAELQEALRRFIQVTPGPATFHREFGESMAKIMVQYNDSLDILHDGSSEVSALTGLATQAGATTVGSDGLTLMESESVNTLGTVAEHANEVTPGRTDDTPEMSNVKGTRAVVEDKASSTRLDGVSDADDGKGKITPAQASRLMQLPRGIQPNDHQRISRMLNWLRLAEEGDSEALREEAVELEVVDWLEDGPEVRQLVRDHLLAAKTIAEPFEALKTSSKDF